MQTVNQCLLVQCPPGHAFPMQVCMAGHLEFAVTHLLPKGIVRQHSFPAPRTKCADTLK